MKPMSIGLTRLVYLLRYFRFRSEYFNSTKITKRELYRAIIKTWPKEWEQFIYPGEEPVFLLKGRLVDKNIHTYEIAYRKMIHKHIPHFFTMTDTEFHNLIPDYFSINDLRKIVLNYILDNINVG